MSLVHLKKVAIWRCFDFECGLSGHVLADVGPIQEEVNKVNVPKKPSEETLCLEPLGDELIEYFATQKISEEILKKNVVMQMIDDKNVIAYTYRRNGELVNYKFRSITSRKFWQVGFKLLIYIKACWCHFSSLLTIV
uniref:Uncharacterized protein n=1 Tax=Lactuca sativa TaxID=4236 RepID=A0A9R1VHA4_LACSA|nr:hypothetical protein LSAT_V11C500282090 [Lactuca sativa]